MGSHYEKKSNSEAIIDRLFLSLPGWVVCRRHLQAATIDSAAFVSDSIVSDHAAVMITITPRSARPLAQRPLAKHLFQGPRCQQ
eukprot:5232030-Pyramimonas_sp.AAC.1